MRNEELVYTLSIHSHFYRKTGLTIVNLSKGVFEQCRLTGSGFFSFLSGIFGQICGQIVSIMRQRLRNTNLVALIHFKKKKTTLPVEVRRSKTPCLSSLIKGVHPDGKLRRISPFRGAKRARTHERAVKPLAFSLRPLARDLHDIPKWRACSQAATVAIMWILTLLSKTFRWTLSRENFLSCLARMWMAPPHTGLASTETCSPLLGRWWK